MTVPMANFAEKFDNKYWAQTVKTFTIFPAWANTQAGVEFEISDIHFTK
ncbi:hypothetical protein [Vibrio sp. B1ASS3]|nr:hypothetical protein [Vibrio sp. B1ASS3]